MPKCIIIDKNLIYRFTKKCTFVKQNATTTKKISFCFFTFPLSISYDRERSAWF